MLRISVLDFRGIGSFLRFLLLGPEEIPAGTARVAEIAVLESDETVQGGGDAHRGEMCPVFRIVRFAVRLDFAGQQIGVCAQRPEPEGIRSGDLIHEGLFVSVSRREFFGVGCAAIRDVLNAFRRRAEVMREDAVPAAVGRGFAFAFGRGRAF